MSESHFEIDPAVAAATQMQVRHNAEAIADALSTIEVLAGLLQTLEAGARGLALRETSRACEVSACDPPQNIRNHARVQEAYLGSHAPAEAA